MKDGEQIVASLILTWLKLLELSIGSNAALLINDPEIFFITDPGYCPLTVRNCLRGTVIRIQCDGVESEVVIQLHSGDSLEAPYSVIISN
ncbi:MAG: hypothetical protein PHD43_12320 [Methylococcales bacterium]|nr:hypothetical protein [Methylococcales bacterium]